MGRPDGLLRVKAALALFIMAAMLPTMVYSGCCGGCGCNWHGTELCLLGRA
jgi:hypothetical protein